MGKNKNKKRRKNHAKRYKNKEEIISKPSSKSLGRVLYEDQEIKKYGSVKSKSSSNKKERQKQLDNEYMDEKTSKRILELSREQLLEEEEEEEKNNYEGSNKMINSSSSSIGNDNKKKGF